MNLTKLLEQTAETQAVRQRIILALVDNYNGYQSTSSAIPLDTNKVLADAARLTAFVLGDEKALEGVDLNPLPTK